MSLLDVDGLKPFAMMTGGSINNGTVSTGVVRFCVTMLSSNKINRLSDDEVQVKESGVYEINFPLTLKADSSSYTMFVDVAVNGIFVQIASFSATSSNVAGGQFTYTIPMLYNDTMSIRARINTPIANFTTSCSSSKVNVGFFASVFPTITIKKI